MSEYPEWQQILVSRSAAICMIGLLQLPIVFKKQLAELKIVSYLFLVVTIFFICLLAFELVSREEQVADLNDLLTVKADHHLVTAISILVFAFSIQFMTFPTYAELEKRTSRRYGTVSIVSTTMYGGTFAITAIIGVLMFGKDVDPDLLSNIAKIPGRVSVMLRVAYCFILLFHIPYYFFTVKEYTLVIFDELFNRSMSTHLEQKLADSLDKKDEVEEEEKEASHSREEQVSRSASPAPSDSA